MSDRIMVMNKGKIEQIGTPMHLYDDPATPFVADFIGQANLLYGTLVSVEDKYGIVDVAGRKVKARMGVLNPPKVGGKALLIVRPENLNIGASDNCLAVKLINRLFEGDRVDYQFEVIEIVPQSENILEREKYHIQRCYKENPEKSLNIMCTANLETEGENV